MPNNDRHKTVEATCEKCGKVFYPREERVRVGLGKFCSRKCFSDATIKLGRENYYEYYDSVHKRWMVRWRDEETTKFHVQYRSKFIWESAFGKVPTKHEIHHKNFDKHDDRLENLQLVSVTEHRKIHGSDRNIIDGVTHKKCFRCGIFYPEASFSGTYCKSCYAEYVREYRSKKKV